MAEQRGGTCSGNVNCSLINRNCILLLGLRPIVHFWVCTRILCVLSVWREFLPEAGSPVPSQMRSVLIPLRKNIQVTIECISWELGHGAVGDLEPAHYSCFPSFLTFGIFFFLVLFFICQYHPHYAWLMMGRAVFVFAFVSVWWVKVPGILTLKETFPPIFTPLWVWELSLTFGLTSDPPHGAVP